MTSTRQHMFDLREAAVAYAAAAERLFGNGDAFLTGHPAVVPIFASMLFQSLEISIKAVGIESGLFTMEEARDRKNRSGHGVQELAALAVKKLGGDTFDPIIMALTFSNENDRSAQFIREMICGTGLEKTRELYCTRGLGYGQLYEGDFALITPLPEWVDSVKQTAVNVPTAIDIISQWLKSASNSKNFVIWFKER